MKPARLILFLALAWAPLFPAKKKYDERGNVIQVPASVEASAAPAALAPVAAGEEKPPLAAGSGTDRETQPATADGAAAEEAQALANQRNPLTQVYLENAQMHLRAERTDKALEYLKKSVEAGEDVYSREAKLTSLWLRARRGDSGLEAESESLDEKSKSGALLRMADGYAACAKEQVKRTECASEAERIYAYLGELTPRSPEGRLARVRLGFLLLDAGKAEAALPHLSKTLLDEGNDARTGRQLRDLPLDRAYYSLGQLYERPWYHRDTHKAAAAYKQVLKYGGSPYHRMARERIAYLEKYGTGYSRP